MSISTWRNYCLDNLSEEERESVDFTFLLNRSCDEQGFKDIFSHFPQARELTSRCLNLSYSKRRSSAVTLSNKEILNLVTTDIEKLRKVCVAAKNENIIQILDTKNIEILDISNAEYQKLHNDETFNQFIDTINDYNIFNCLKQFPGYLDIESSLYHYSGNNFRLTWYLCEPLLLMENVFDGYYILWANYIDYFLTSDGIKIVRTDKFKQA